ncbi:DUF4190 domain-containing protein [Pirellulaceae bacterium SH449]
MIIFGWGSRKSVSGSGHFDCPLCKTTTPFQHIKSRRWFNLFFVPIFPLSGSDDSINCMTCRTSFRPDALPDLQSKLPVSTSISPFSIVGMLLGIVSLIMSCVFFVSGPFALFAVILSHTALGSIKKNQPHMEGRWQAVTGLVTGYLALTFSIAVGVIVMMAPRWFPRDPGGASNWALSEDKDEGDRSFQVSESGNASFKSAEYEIAAKRDQPVGRGNSKEAIELAEEFAEKLKELCDISFTSNKRPFQVFSEDEYLTFCELKEDRCLFLVHVPSYRKFTGSAKKTLADIAWATAQVVTVEKLKPNVRLGVGLRGVLLYGDIMLGTTVESSESRFTPYRAGDKADLIAFFEPSRLANQATVDNTAAFQQASDSEHDRSITDSTMERNFFDDGKVTQTAPSESKPSVPDVDSKGISESPAVTSPRTTRDRKIAADRRQPSPPAKPPKPEEPKFENKIPIKLVMTLDNKSWGFTSLAFSPNGKWIAAGKMDQSIIIFNAQSGEVVHHEERISELSSVSSIAFDRSSERIIAGGSTGQAVLWEVSNSGLLSNSSKAYRFDGELRFLKTSPIHSFFMGASAKGTIAWQAFGESKSQPRLLQEFGKDIQAIWLPSDGIEAQATDGSKIIRFSLRDGTIASSQDLGLRYANFATFSDNGNRIAVAASDTLHFIDQEEGSSVRNTKLPRGESVYALEFHPNGHWVMIGMRAKVAVYDFETAEVIAYLDPGSIFYQTNIAFRSDGQFLATSSNTAQDAIRIFELGSSP